MQPLAVVEAGDGEAEDQRGDEGDTHRGPGPGQARVGLGPVEEQGAQSLGDLAQRLELGEGAEEPGECLDGHGGAGGGYGHRHEDDGGQEHAGRAEGGEQGQASDADHRDGGERVEPQQAEVGGVHVEDADRGDLDQGAHHQ